MQKTKQIQNLDLGQEYEKKADLYYILMFYFFVGGGGGLLHIRFFSFFQIFILIIIILFKVNMSLPLRRGSLDRTIDPTSAMFFYWILCVKAFVTSYVRSRPLVTHVTNTAKNGYLRVRFTHEMTLIERRIMRILQFYL